MKQPYPSPQASPHCVRKLSDGERAILTSTQVSLYEMRILFTQFFGQHRCCSLQVRENIADNKNASPIFKTQFIRRKWDIVHHVPTIIRVSYRIFPVLMGIILLITVSGIIEAQDLASANTAYDNGDYETAIVLYESVLAVGEGSGDIYYNLGNAYYLKGEIGNAMQNYLRAEVYLPRNRAIASQIEQIRAERVDGHLDEVDPVILLYNLTGNYLTLTETSILAFVIWLVFFLVLAIGLRRKGWSVVIVVSGVMMLIMIGLLPARLYVETQRPVVVILEESVQVMSGPGENYLPLYSLYEGLELRVLEERGEWVRFMLADGRQGWMYRAVLSRESNG